MSPWFFPLLALVVGIGAGWGLIRFTRRPSAPRPLTAPEKATAALRDELLERDWLDAKGLSRQLGLAPEEAQKWVTARRTKGELLGVWSAGKKTYLYPSFQFLNGGTGPLNPQVKDLLTRLAEIPDFTPEADRGGWRRVFWLHGETAFLRSPQGQSQAAADVFQTDPERVFALIEQEKTSAAGA